jgi:hypothetical protein
MLKFTTFAQIIQKNKLGNMLTHSRRLLESAHKFLESEGLFALPKRDKFRRFICLNLMLVGNESTRIASNPIHYGI